MRDVSPGRRADLLALGLLVLLPIVLFPQVVAGNRIFGDGDNRGVHFPHKLLMARELSEGDFPIWSRFTASGYPILAESQTGVLYPPHLLLFWILDTARAFNVCILIHVALAACGTYLFARRVGAAPGPALVAGVAYVLQGAYADKLLMAQLLEPRSLVPWAFLLAEMAATAQGMRRALRDAAGLAAAIALALLAGSAQDAYFTALYTSIYMALRRPRRIPLIAFTAFMTALFAAPQILATRELTTMTYRAGGLASALLSEGKYRFGPELRFWIFPYLHAESATFVAQGFAGIAVYTLALIGVAGALGRPEGGILRSPVLPLSAVGTLAIPFSLGSATVLTKIFVLIPGVAYFRLPHRSLIFFALAAIILAALGLERVREGARAAGAWRVASRAIAAACATGAGATSVAVLRAIGRDPAPARLTIAAFSLACAAAAFAAIAFGFARAFPLRRAAVGLAALAALFELTVMFHTEDPTVPMDDLLTISSSGQWLAAQPGPFRITIEAVRMMPTPNKSVGVNPYLWKKDPDALPDKLPGPKLIRWGDVANTSGPTSMRVASYAALLTRIENNRPQAGPKSFRGNAALYGLYNVKYIVFYRPVEDPDLKLVHQDGARVYENLKALPRAFFAPRARVVAEAEEQDAVLSLQDPAGTLVLRQGEGGEPLEGSARGEVRIDALRSRNIVLHVSADGPGYVYYSEQHYPGWTATLDGAPAKLLHANVAFMAVKVGAGEHEIRLHFHQNGLVPGLMLTGLGILIAVSLLVSSRESRG